MYARSQNEELLRETVCNQDQESIRNKSDREMNVRTDELGRVARRLREELKRKFVKCRQECMAMRDARKRPNRTRKGSNKKRTARRSKMDFS